MVILPCRVVWKMPLVCAALAVVVIICTAVKFLYFKLFPQYAKDVPAPAIKQKIGCVHSAVLGVSWWCSALHRQRARRQSCVPFDKQCSFFNLRAAWLRPFATAAARQTTCLRACRQAGWHAWVVA